VWGNPHEHIEGLHEDRWDFEAILYSL